MLRFLVSGTKIAMKIIAKKQLIVKMRRVPYIPKLIMLHGKNYDKKGLNDFNA